MTRKLGVGFTVVKEVLDGELAVEDAKKILRGHTVSGLVEEDVNEFRGGLVSGEEGEEDDYLGNGVEGAS